MGLFFLVDLSFKEIIMATEITKETHKEGAKILISGKIAAQVNPLTNQRIPSDNPVIALYDRWIEIQLEAGVLVKAEM